MTQEELLKTVLTKLEVIETKLNYLHQYVQEKEGELNPTCKPPVYLPIGAVENYVCRLNNEKEKENEPGQDPRPISYD